MSPGRSSSGESVAAEPVSSNRSCAACTCTRERTSTLRVTTAGSRSCANCPGGTWVRTPGERHDACPDRPREGDDGTPGVHRARPAYRARGVSTEPHWWRHDRLEDDRAPPVAPRTHRHAAQIQESVASDASLWGWKEPNSHLMIRHLHRHFGDRLRYVHVIRNGLDMAQSRNQLQLIRWGSVFGVPVDRPIRTRPRRWTIGSGRTRPRSTREERCTRVASTSSTTTTCAHPQPRSPGSPSSWAHSLRTIASRSWRAPSVRQRAVTVCRVRCRAALRESSAGAGGGPRLSGRQPVITLYPVTRPAPAPRGNSRRTAPLPRRAAATVDVADSAVSCAGGLRSSGRLHWVSVRGFILPFGERHVVEKVVLPHLKRRVGNGAVTLRGHSRAPNFGGSAAVETIATSDAGARGRRAPCDTPTTRSPGSDPVSKRLQRRGHGAAGGGSHSVTLARSRRASWPAPVGGSAPRSRERTGADRARVSVLAARTMSELEGVRARYARAYDVDACAVRGRCVGPSRCSTGSSEYRHRAGPAGSTCSWTRPAIHGPIGRIPWESGPPSSGSARSRPICTASCICATPPLPHMIAAEDAGDIIAFSGRGRHRAPLPRFSAYGSSKAAVVRFVETIAEELRHTGVESERDRPGPRRHPAAGRSPGGARQPPATCTTMVQGSARNEARAPSIPLVPAGVGRLLPRRIGRVRGPDGLDSIACTARSMGFLGITEYIVLRRIRHGRGPWLHTQATRDPFTLEALPGCWFERV